MADPYAVRSPDDRRPSHTALAGGIRTEVTAWRAGGYPGASATSKRLLEHWFLDEHQTADGQPFRYYFAQREAIETLIYVFEVAGVRSVVQMARFSAHPLATEPEPYPRFVVKMATGSGKTKVMSLAIAWSYFHALREPASPLTPTALLVAPNLIVYERLRDDFDNGRVFRADPVIPPEWRSDFDLQVCLRDTAIPASAPGVLALTNVQALYERRPPQPADPVSALLGPRPPARLNQPDPMLVQLARRGRILALNDEAHHLHDRITLETGEPLVAVQTLHRLHEAATDGIAVQLDFSATPRQQNGALFTEIVSDYPLAEAIEDGIVKRPVIGELSGDITAVSDDASVRYRQRLSAGVSKWREFREAYSAVGRKPLLFVMAEDTAAADQIAAYLETISDLSGKVLTIHVNAGGRDRGEIAGRDLENARRWAREVDSEDNPYAAIVSVLMLREGWDVRNVTVIVPLRAYTATANILPEQTLGRGLRRMTPPGSGVDETVVVIEHEAFRSLWDQALADDDLSVERQNLDDVHVQPQVVAVEPDRVGFDIAIPLLSRVLTREASGVSRLRVEDLPERALRLPDTLRSDTIDYTGRDMLSGEVVERAQYPAEQAHDPSAVLAYYVNEISHESRLTGQFAVLAPLVKDYIERRLFGGPVDLADPLVLGQLQEPSVQETIFAVFREAVDDVTLRSASSASYEHKDLLLSSTRPFLWSGETASARKSVFNLQPCDSGLEVRFAGFLDTADDVAAFAKLAREVRFSLEYRAEGGRLGYYYPDFVVRLTDGSHAVIETKGLADLDVPHKDRRAHLWAVDATVATGTRWRYLRVDEDVFDRHRSGLRTMAQLLDLTFARRREAELAETATPRRRTRAEIIAAMEDISDRMGTVAGLDEALDKLRDEPDA